VDSVLSLGSRVPVLFYTKHGEKYAESPLMM